MEHGLSGQIDRVVVELANGRALSVVVKQETAEAVRRELLFRLHNRETLGASIPICFGGASDPGSGRGVLVCEDVSPAEQGDVLRGCTNRQAGAVVQLLARLHATTLLRTGGDLSSDVPRWSAKTIEPEVWSDRLIRARDRFPLIVRAELFERLRDAPARFASAGEQLEAGPASWIHSDAHLDNVLWRPDGTPVLLDWCNSAVGPPAVDLARFVTEGVYAGAEPRKAHELVEIYVEALRRGGEVVALADLWDQIDASLARLVQSAVEWAGRAEELEQASRAAALRESFLRNVFDWLEWRDVV